MHKLRFIVAEKSYLIRKGIVSIINRLDNATVVKELENLDSINSEILNHQPDFIVINPSLFPEKSNFRNFEIKLDLSQKGIALLANCPKRQGMHHKFRLIIDLEENKETIVNKLTSLLDPYMHQSHSSVISNELSDREKTILQFVAKGNTNKEIAAKLFLSTHTVMTHRKNITAKLGIKTISGLTVYAILNGLVSLNEIS